MKINKGMYIRFKNNKGIQYIGKLININEYREPCFKYAIEVTWYDDYIFIGDDDIIGEPSFNLIDLIKDGDYANGYPVVQIMDCYENDTKRDLGRTIYIDKPCAGVKIGWTPLLNGNIKDVVTKEQFNSCKYVVERDTNE